MKRTTLILDRALYARLKKAATDEGRTLTDVVERTLRRGLDSGSTGRRPRIPLPSYDLGPFLIDPADRRSQGPSPARDERTREG